MHMTTILFDNDDAAYLRWLGEHPVGFVVNIRLRHDPTYLVLHPAGCKSITLCGNAEEAPGGFMEGPHWRSRRGTGLFLVHEGIPALDCSPSRHTPRAYP